MNEIDFCTEWEKCHICVVHHSFLFVCSFKEMQSTTRKRAIHV